MKKTEEVLSEKEKEIAQWIGIGFALIIIAIVYYLRFKGIIPGPAKVIDWLEQLYAQYGYIVVFVSALVEGLFLINFYVPGSTAILLGVVFARRSGLSIPLIIALVILGFFISYCINYWIGRKGFYKLLTKFGYGQFLEDTETSLKHKGVKLIFTSFFHPNLAALVSTGAGVIRLPFWKFALSALLALTLWDSIWGVVGYMLGEQALKLFESWLIYPIMLAWTLGAIYLPMMRKRKV